MLDGVRTVVELATVTTGSDTPASITSQRASAARVAKWLVDKGRPDDAVAVLAVWASSGPNDGEGQGLLAEALRIDPAARVAQQAFEHMEGVEGDHPELADGRKRFGPEDLAKLEVEMRRPSFRRAQMGFNNNIRSGDAVFHVQTEDSGLDQPHVITHLFADGGRVIKSHKRSYADQIARADIGDFVRKLMKAQHLEMVLALREGRFAEVVAGRAVGGMELLTQPPNVENIRKLASSKQARAETSGPSVAVRIEAPEAPPSPPAGDEPQKFSLQVLRSLTGGPERYAPADGRAVIGSAGEVNLPGERFCHPREAKVAFREERLWLEDLEGGNGVFLRIRTPVELDYGDEFVIGDQLLRVERNPVSDDGPDPDPTYFYSSPKWPSSFRVVQIFEGGALGCAVVARGNTLQVGSAIGDLIFPDDPLMADQHCVIEEQAGTVMLTDLSTRTGVFVRIRGEQELTHGDELLVGRTRLVVEIG
jgi:hypothetical protein